MLDNAARHAPRPSTRAEGGGEGSDAPTVSVRIGRFEDGFYVADDGRGIPPSERDLVFDPGYSTREDGDGFGLAVVEQIANGHGWTVAAEPPESGGTCIEVRGVGVDDEWGSAGTAR